MIKRLDYNKEFPHNIFMSEEYKIPVKASQLNYEEKNGKQIAKKDRLLLVMLAQSICWLELMANNKLVWIKRPTEHFDNNMANHNKWHRKTFDGEGIIGSEAGKATLTEAYPKFSFKGNRIYHHEAIWALAHGRWPEKGLEIHHIDGNTKVLNAFNLKEVSKQENLDYRNNGNGSRIIEIRENERKRNIKDKNIRRVDMDRLIEKVVEIGDNQDIHHGRPQFRIGGIDDEHVEEIKKELRFDRTALDPLHVVEVGDGKLLIADGFHRYRALKDIGDTEVDVIIHEVLDGEDATFTAFSLSAKMNNQKKKLNSGFDNQLILWHKICSGELSIERTYADLTSSFKVGRNTIKEMKKVHAWFTEKGLIPSGSWITDMKMEIESNHGSMLITAETENESMDQVVKAIDKCAEFKSVMGDAALLFGVLNRLGIAEKVLSEWQK